MQCTVLISSAGRRVQLIECFRDDARALGIDLKIVATDICPKLSPACAIADSFYQVPACFSNEYTAVMLEICVKEKVKLIIPTIDPELIILSEARQSFVDAGTEVGVAEAAFVRMADDKYETINYLDSLGVPTPKTSLLSQLSDNSGIDLGNALIKPRSGSASQGILDYSDDAVARIQNKDQYIVQHKLQGDEFTVNAFYDDNGRMCCAIPHRRLEVRSGEVSKGITQKNIYLLEIASQIGDGIHAVRGPLCFQAFVTSQGRASVFEINARFGGGYPLAHRAGGKFTKWLLQQVCGMTPSYNNQWEENLVMLRYDCAVYAKVSADFQPCCR